MKHSDEYNELLKRRTEELKQRDEEIKINTLSQYSTGELKAEIAERVKEGKADSNNAYVVAAVKEKMEREG